MSVIFSTRNRFLKMPQTTSTSKEWIYYQMEYLFNQTTWLSINQLLPIFVHSFWVFYRMPTIKQIHSSIEAKLQLSLTIS